MTVAELIAELSALPQHLKVSVNDERGGNWHETIDFLYHFKPDEGWDDTDEECVTIVVNECV